MTGFPTPMEAVLPLSSPRTAPTTPSAGTRQLNPISAFSCLGVIKQKEKNLARLRQNFKKVIADTLHYFYSPFLITLYLHTSNYDDCSWVKVKLSFPRDSFFIIFYILFIDSFLPIIYVTNLLYNIISEYVFSPWAIT